MIDPTILRRTRLVALIFGGIATALILGSLIAGGAW